MSLAVDYISDGKKTGVIKVGNKTYQTNLFRFPNITNKSPPDFNTDDELFAKELRHLRALDCIKDGAVGSPNLSLNDVYSISFNDLVPRLPFSYLGEVEEKFIHEFASKIKRFTWTKVNSESTLDPPFSSRIVFKESGLDPLRFITEPKFCGNFANEVVDPAGRSPIVVSKGDVLFPNQGEKLTLSKSFFELMGFKNCFLDATRKEGGKYAFDLFIDGVRIKSEVSNGAEFGLSKNVEWFQGNREKNAFIRNIGSGHVDVKNALLMAKEMGDTLQVISMFLWSLTHSNQQYTMTTVDKVVLVQCMIMGLNCILTNTNESVKDKSATRVRSIDVFEAKSDTPQQAKARCKEARDSIIKHNKEFLSCVHRLIKYPETPIEIGGQYEKKLDKSFYIKLSKDIEEINTRLKAIKPISDPTKVNAEIIRMKENYMVHLFFRKNKNLGNIYMTMAKKYTNSEEWLSSYKPLITDNYGKISFAEIAMKEYVIMGGDSKSGSRSQSRSRSRSNTRTHSAVSASSDFTFLEFAPGHLPGEKEEPIYVVTKEGEQVDILAAFKQEVVDVMRQNRYPEHLYIDVFSFLYHHFYIYEEVLYGQDLESIIKQHVASIKIPKQEMFTRRPASGNKQRVTVNLDLNKLPANVVAAIKRQMTKEDAARLDRISRKVSQQKRKRTNVFTQRRRVSDRMEEEE